MPAAGGGGALAARDEVRRRVGEARVGRLATVRPDGAPHAVPVTFVVAWGGLSLVTAGPDSDAGGGRDVVYTVVDAVKPKSTQWLARLRNVKAEPRASLLVDGYDDDWSRLWWVRADGRASERPDGTERDGALALLAAKYPQYAAATGFGALLAIEVERWAAWSAT
jgi:PPOX class probable F420-dependent enzyme